MGDLSEEKSTWAGAEAEFVDRGGGHVHQGGGGWGHLSVYLRYDLFQLNHHRNGKQTSNSADTLYIHVCVIKALVYCFVSRCCNSMYGKAIEYNTDDLTSFLALLPTILAPALLQQAGVGEHRICSRVSKQCAPPPFYTNSDPGNRPI